MIDDTVRYENGLSETEITDFCDTFVESLQKMMKSKRGGVITFGRYTFNADELMIVEMEQATLNINVIGGEV